MVYAQSHSIDLVPLLKELTFIAAFGQETLGELFPTANEDLDIATLFLQSGDV